MKSLLVAAVFLAFAATCLAAPPGYRLLESTAASVNGEVIFISDVSREACFHRCGAVPGQPAAELSLAEARQKLVADALVLQEQKKLGLGAVDNAALAAMAADIASRMKKCAYRCAAAVSDEGIRDLAYRRLMVRDFLDKSVAVFIDVNDEEVRKEMASRIRAGAPDSELSEEKIRRDLFSEEAAAEIRNWFARAASKSRIMLSPMAEP